MGDFSRGLHDAATRALRALTEKAGDNWWKDLLLLWRPSGSPAGKHGLRLAIRQDSLNFYRRGQSVARIGFAYGEPYLEIHPKYVFGPRASGRKCRLKGTEIWHSGLKTASKYDGTPTLLGWIERANLYAKTEKPFVDHLVADNSAIVDLEMGLPKLEGWNGAVRVDCVALELQSDSIRIVFWEAKMIGDGRVRSSTEPKVEKHQMAKYRSYFDSQDRRDHIESSYLTACRLFTDFRAMAQAIGNRVKLDDLISDAASEHLPLRVDEVPRVVVFGDPESQKSGNWAYHEARLREVLKGPCHVADVRPYLLPSKEMLG